MRGLPSYASGTTTLVHEQLEIRHLATRAFRRWQRPFTQGFPF